MRLIWWNLSIYMMFFIMCSPCVNPFVVDSSGKNSVNTCALRIPDYLADWHIHISNSSQDTMTSVSGFQQEQMTFIESNTVPADTGRDGPMDSAWPMFSHDVTHTGRSLFSTENNSGVEIWRMKTDGAGAIWSSAITDNNGIIYIGTKGSTMSLYALNPNGTRKWRFIANGPIWATPALAENGDIYCTTWGTLGYLQAVTQNGTERWHFDPEIGSISAPTIGLDGTIYFGTDGHNIFAVNPDGTEKWRYTTGYIVMGSPAISIQDGTIYIGSGDHYLYALNPDGTLRWRFNTGGEIKGSASLALDGTIYVPSFDGYLYALYPNGTMRWRASTGEGLAAAGVALGKLGTIYVGTEMLRAYNPDGTLKWMTDVQGSIYGTVPAVSADGTIYVSAGNSLVAVNPDGTVKWQTPLSNEQIRSSPSIGPDDRVYVGSTYSDYGNLHAFGLGPLYAEAGGPYSGLASDTPVQFNGLAFGGIPSYTFLWDFGDGHASTEQNPSHLYQNIGTYNATFTITDNEGNTSNDTTTATITYSPPTVWYIKPEQALYIGNIRICKFHSTLIFGKITVQADASHPLLEIQRIEFYLDFELQAVDDTAPYTWTWNQRYLFSAEHTHRIIIKAITTEGTEKTLGKEVHKYF